MRLIDADAFDKCLEGAEIEATRSQKYVFSSAINTIRGNLANFPTVNQWVPCSERLPELDDEVSVTDDRGELRHCIFCTRGKTWCGFITYEKGIRIKAVAWMPLPSPYQEEGEEE